MRYRLREMTVDDIPSVIDGETRAFGDTLGYDLLYTDLTLNPYAHYVVLEIKRKVRGYISFWTNEEADIVNFYVDEEFRGLGFGEMLLQFMIDVCEASDIKTISLEVRKSNIVALALYDKFGFRKESVREKYYTDGEDALVLKKTLEVKK